MSDEQSIDTDLGASLDRRATGSRRRISRRARAPPGRRGSRIRPAARASARSGGGVPGRGWRARRHRRSDRRGRSMRRFVLCLIATLAAAAGAAGRVGAPRAAASRIAWVLGSPTIPSLLPGVAERPVVWLGRARALGSRWVRIGVLWGDVAPDTPARAFPGRRPAATPHYKWSALDRAVRPRPAHGQTPMINVHSAPRWAEGAGMPTWATEGPGTPTRRPSAPSPAPSRCATPGHFPDPLTADVPPAGALLPGLERAQPAPATSPRNGWGTRTVASSPIARVCTARCSTPSTPGSSAQTGRPGVRRRDRPVRGPGRAGPDAAQDLPRGNVLPQRVVAAHGMSGRCGPPRRT